MRFNLRASGGRELITKSQTAKQIMQQMRRAEFNSRETSKKLSKFFKKRDEMETCELVYVYLRKTILYSAEPREDQTAKTINRFIVDGYGDCKHYATASVGILNACGIPAWFVLVSQDKRNKTPSHAYACAMVRNKVIVIDPCRNSFNSECKHFYKYNIPPKKK
jgi:hypothetical protein